MAAALAPLQGSNGHAALPSDLQGVEQMCQQLYTAQDSATRKRAESVLLSLSTSTSHLPKCLMILDNSAMPYAQKFAAWTLTKLVTNHWIQVKREDRLHLRAYVLNYLARQGPSLEHLVVMELSTLLCRVTKLGWQDDDQYRTIVDDLNSFLGASTQHCIIGLQVLSRLVTEMNSTASIAKRRSLTQSQARKVAISFRELLLQKVFKISINTLAQLPPPPALAPLRQYSLDLALACLSYDFVGGSLDESSEDLGTIHIPVGWHAVIEDATTFNVFMDSYKSLCTSLPTQSSKCLECLVQLSSMRRSLFATEALRVAHLRRHIEGTLHILQTRVGLEDHDNFHHFCRWVSRLKTNYQMDELTSLTAYDEWLERACRFTMESLASDWNWIGASLHYLLHLWTRLIAAKPYMKGGISETLDRYLYSITEQFVNMRLQSLGQLNDDDEDEDFSEHLNVVPPIFRMQYQKSSRLLTSLFDPKLDHYKQMVSKGFQGINPADVSRLEREMAWLTRIIGSVVAGRSQSSGSDAVEVVDGELSARVFQLMIYTTEADASARQRPGVTPQSLATPAGRARKTKGAISLDEAIIDFAQAFRRAYVGEEAVATSKVYVRMAERLGMTSILVVLNVLATKIACNLRNYGVVDGLEIIGKSLTLLSDLAGGYSSGRLLCKLTTIQEMVNFHDEEHFPFMAGPDNKMGRHRTMFCNTIMRIMFASGGPEFSVDTEFVQFLEPLRRKLDLLGGIQTKEQFLKDDSVKKAAIGVMRDLRGAVSTLSGRKAYNVFFEWMHPGRTAIVLKICEVFSEAGVNEVTSPLLKFVSDFIFNRSQRISFDSSSPNGILLFRETSKILVIYGTCTLAYWERLGGPEMAGKKGIDVYRGLYKGIWICFLIFQRSLGGGYVNFGVFSLYGDPALKDAMEVCFRLIMAVPTDQIIVYPKIARAYFALIEILCTSHPKELVQVEHGVFCKIVRSLQEGLQSHEVWMSSQSASALDQLSAFRFKETSKGTKWGQLIKAHVDKSPELFPACLEIVFNTMIHVDCTNQWSLSRPLLGLILTNEEAFMRIRANTVHSQPTPERQASVEATFTKLMKNINPTLEGKNRDRFTHQVTQFRIALRSEGITHRMR